MSEHEKEASSEESSASGGTGEGNHGRESSMAYLAHGAACDAVQPVQGDGGASTVTFLPERFVRRDTEVLAVRLSENSGVSGGGKAGDWAVTDDRGRRFVLSNEDFHYEYKENEAHGGPGKINILLPGTNAIGCRAVLITVGDDTAIGGERKTLDGSLNEFFERPEHFGLAIASIQQLSPSSLLVFVTRPFTKRELDERNEVAQEVREAINRKHEAAIEAQAQAILEADKAEREAAEAAAKKAVADARYVELGKRHEQNCGKKHLTVAK